MALRGRLVVAVTCTALAGCQLVLGFEEHTPFPEGGGGGGGAGVGGGPAGGAPSGFGDPEEVASGLGPLDAVAIGGADIYVLEQQGTSHRLQRARDGSLEIVASNLVRARGLVTAGDEVITSHGPLDAGDGDCHVSAFSGRDRRDVMRDGADAGENNFYAVAAGGDVVAASYLEQQGNDHSDVRTAPLAGAATDGKLIGLGEDDAEPVPSIAISGGTFFWVDSQLDDVMSSAGSEVGSVIDPPGDSVNTLAEGLTPLYEVVVADGKIYVAQGSRVAAVNVSGETDELSAAVAPRGLAADGAVVVWAEADKVRAYLVATGEVVTLDAADDEPTDVALSPASVVYVTLGGRIVQIPRI